MFGRKTRKQQIAALAEIVETMEQHYDSAIENLQVSVEDLRQEAPDTSGIERDIELLEEFKAEFEDVDIRTLVADVETTEEDLRDIRTLLANYEGVEEATTQLAVRLAAFDFVVMKIARRVGLATNGDTLENLVDQDNEHPTVRPITS